MDSNQLIQLVVILAQGCELLRAASLLVSLISKVSSRFGFFNAKL